MELDCRCRGGIWYFREDKMTAALKRGISARLIFVADGATRRRWSMGNSTSTVARQRRSRTRRKTDGIITFRHCHCQRIGIVLRPSWRGWKNRNLCLMVHRRLLMGIFGTTTKSFGSTADYFRILSQKQHRLRSNYGNTILARANGRSPPRLCPKTRTRRQSSELQKVPESVSPDKAWDSTLADISIAGQHRGGVPTLQEST